MVYQSSHLHTDEYIPVGTCVKVEKELGYTKNECLPAKQFELQFCICQMSQLLFSEFHTILTRTN